MTAGLSQPPMRRIEKAGFWLLRARSTIRSLADRKPIARYAAIRAHSLAACSAELHHQGGPDPCLQPAAVSLTLTPQELQTLDAAHPVRSADVLRLLLDRSKRWLWGFRNAR